MGKRLVASRPVIVLQDGGHNLLEPKILEDVRVPKVPVHQHPRDTLDLLDNLRLLNNLRYLCGIARVDEQRTPVDYFHCILLSTA